MCSEAPNTVLGPGSDLTCGPLYNNRSCPLATQCCSEHGFCGTGLDYCQSPQCLMGFGRCDASIVPEGRNTSWVDRTFLPDTRIEVDGKEVGYGKLINHLSSKRSNDF